MLRTKTNQHKNSNDNTICIWYVLIFFIVNKTRNEEQFTVLNNNRKSRFNLFNLNTFLFATLQIFKFDDFKRE